MGRRDDRDERYPAPKRRPVLPSDERALARETDRRLRWLVASVVSEARAFPEEPERAVDLLGRYRRDWELGPRELRAVETELARVRGDAFVAQAFGPPTAASPQSSASLAPRVRPPLSTPPRTAVPLSSRPRESMPVTPGVYSATGLGALARANRASVPRATGSLAGAANVLLKSRLSPDEAERRTTSLDPELLREAVGGRGVKMPHLERIESEIGPQEALRRIHAVVGGPRAGRLLDALGAEAATIGDAVLFRDDPTVEQARHEAAHVLDLTRGQTMDRAAFERRAERAETGDWAAAFDVLRGASELPWGARLAGPFAAYDLTPVQAHAGPDARQAAESEGATAYAHGEDIVFAKPPDLHTAAHELSHVVQQRQGKPERLPEAALEREADRAADAAVRGESVAPILGAVEAGAGATPVVQRKPDKEQHEQDKAFLVKAGRTLERTQRLAEDSAVLFADRGMSDRAEQQQGVARWASQLLVSQAMMLSVTNGGHPPPKSELDAFRRELALLTVALWDERGRQLSKMDRDNLHLLEEAGDRLAMFAAGLAGVPVGVAEGLRDMLLDIPEMLEAVAQLFEDLLSGELLDKVAAMVEAIVKALVEKGLAGILDELVEGFKKAWENAKDAWNRGFLIGRVIGHLLADMAVSAVMAGAAKIGAKLLAKLERRVPAIGAARKTVQRAAQKLKRKKKSKAKEAPGEGRRKSRTDSDADHGETGPAKKERERRTDRDSNDGRETAKPGTEDRETGPHRDKDHDERHDGDDKDTDERKNDRDEHDGKKPPSAATLKREAKRAANAVFRRLRRGFHLRGLQTLGELRVDAAKGPAPTSRHPGIRLGRPRIDRRAAAVGWWVKVTAHLKKRRKGLAKRTGHSEHGWVAPIIAEGGKTGRRYWHANLAAAIGRRLTADARALKRQPGTDDAAVGYAEKIAEAVKLSTMPLPLGPMVGAGLRYRFKSTRNGNKALFRLAFVPGSKTWRVVECDLIGRKLEYEAKFKNADPELFDAKKHLDPQEAKAFDDAVKLRKKGIDDAAGKAMGKGRNGDLKKARDGSQAAGELAGKAYLRKTFPDHQVVKSPLAPTKSGGQGAGSFDMLRKGGKDGDEWVIAECKGGDGGLGKRISAHDEYQLAQQGTREYVESMIATWRERIRRPSSSLTARQRIELRRQADSLDEALRGGRLRYLLVRQPFDNAGKPLPAESLEFML